MSEELQQILLNSGCLLALLVASVCSAVMLRSAKDERSLQHIIIAIGAVFSVLALVASNILSENGVVVAFFTTVVGVVFPLFFYYMGSTHIWLSKLTDTVATFRRDERLNKVIRSAWQPVFERMFDRSTELNRLVVGDDWNARVHRMFLSVVTQKALNNLEQLERDHIFLRRDLFAGLWRSLTSESTKYLSVCDLSAYSRASSLQVERAEDDWEERIRAESAHLLQNCPDLTSFDKIIVYDTRVGAAGDDAPGCATAAGCNGSACTVSSCLVNKVVSLWQDAAPALAASGIHGHGLSNGDGDGMIWLVRRSQLAGVFANLAKAPPGGDAATVSTMDIGLFGESVVGEEFKLLAETFSNVVATPTPAQADSDGRHTDDFIYMMRSNSTLRHRIWQEIRHVRRSLTRVA